MSKRTMIIDGNFMLKRLLRDYTFMEDPVKDRIGFLTDLSQHIACEIERVAGFVDHIILCKDSKSWRKDVMVKQQLRIDEFDNILEPNSALDNYKANRIQSEDRDWKQIYDTFSEFCTCLNEKFDIPFISVHGAEGDDCIFAVSNYLRSNKIKSCIYCTDSDLNQLVSPSNVILRRIRSKAAPEGEIVVDPKFWDMYTKIDNYNNNNPLAIFTTDITKYKDDITMLEGKSIDNGIVVYNKYWAILKSMFMGSGKDNVPEIFTWKAKTTNRHITTTFMNIALSLCQVSPGQITEEMLYDEAFLKSLIINLCITCNQYKLIPYTDYLYEVVVSNRQLNYLSTKEIPNTVIADINDCIEVQKHMKANIVQLSKSVNILDELHVSSDKMYQQLGL